jgi:hypothetical protein
MGCSDDFHSHLCQPFPTWHPANMMTLGLSGLVRGQSPSSIVKVNLNVRTSPVVGFSNTTFMRLDLLAIASHRLIWNSPTSRFLVRWTRRKPLQSVRFSLRDSAAAASPAGSNKKVTAPRIAVALIKSYARQAQLRLPGVSFSGSLIARVPPLAPSLCVRRG